MLWLFNFFDENNVIIAFNNFNKILESYGSCLSSILPANEEKKKAFRAWELK
jgi:hypothetical protein